MSRAPRKRPSRGQAKLLRDYERELLRLGRSSRTIYTRVLAARRFLLASDRPFSRVRPQDVRAYLARRRAEGLGKSAQQGELFALRSLFRVGVQLGLIRRDPTEGLRVEGRATPIRLFLTEEQVTALLAAASELKEGAWLGEPLALRDRALLELLYGVGLRASEAQAVRTLDLDLTEGTLRVRRAKRGESRLLPLPLASLPALRRYFDEGRPRLVRAHVETEGFFFLSRRGGPLKHRSAVYSVVRRVAERAGVRAHPHAFRRSAATHLSQAGVSVAVIQKLLGHSNVATTSLYLGADPSELRRAVETLELEEEVDSAE